jgi:hypothetical protein
MIDNQFAFIIPQTGIKKTPPSQAGFFDALGLDRFRFADLVFIDCHPAATPTEKFDLCKLGLANVLLFC